MSLTFNLRKKGRNEERPGENLNNWLLDPGDFFNYQANLKNQDYSD
jgi:hypothetical protein